MDKRVEALVCMTILAAVFKINCAKKEEATNGIRYKLSSFCFTSESCPDMKYCHHHQCRFPVTFEEFRTVMKIHYSRQRQISSKGMPCSSHMDCSANEYLCDTEQGICRLAGKVFQKLNRCKDLKKSCHSDADCSCLGHEMKCEAEPSGTESECVIVRRLQSSAAKLFSKTKRKTSRNNRTADENKTEKS
ncbi:uncharacterized protein LOC135683830 [Rhopilema esculentum]|uniref:uncharacterized protein LOC135683830 n=1 Tax=Rhopilema esculentum TaxID=499914 RepID=UPI0031D8BE97